MQIIKHNTGDHIAAHIRAGLAPVTAGVGMGGLTWAGVYLLTTDPRMSGLWLMAGGWVAFMLTFGLCSDNAKRPQVIQEIRPDTPKPPPGWNQTFEMSLTNIKVGIEDSRPMMTRVRPSIPVYISIRQARAMAWGLLYDHRPLTVREWSGDDNLLSRDSQYTPLIAYMERCRFVLRKRRGVELTETGRAWMHQILLVHGRPPT